MRSTILLKPIHIQEPMKPKFRSLIAAFAPLSRSSLIVCASLCAAGSAHAASQTWDGDTDVNWSTAANWVNTAVPGIVYTANNTNTADIATFNGVITVNGGAASPVTTETNRMIGRILFDTGNAGSYFIGAASTPPTLTLGNNLTNIDVTATVVNPQTINSPIALHLPSSTNGNGSIQSNSSSSSATLTLAGGILNSPNSSRGTAWTLGGVNTGNNLISGTVTISNSGGQASSMTKNGIGTWILSAANTIGGGVNVSDGTLVAQNAGAFGAAGLTINGGLVRVDGGITLTNNNVTLNNSSEFRSNGSNGVNKLTIGVAAVAPVISTVSSGDILTIGNASNSLSGGGSSTLLNVSGPGTISLAMASNYVGGWQFNSGTMTLGNNTALGSATAATVSFGASSSATLQTYGFNPTVTGLNTNATTGTPVIQNGDISPSILTVNNTANNTFAGTLTDGSTGTLGLTKGGAGTLTLAGTNTYTGVTVVNNGTLRVNTSSSTPTVTVNGGATLGGTGTISGAVTINNLGHLAPGSSVGTLSVGTLAIESGAILDYEFSTGNDLTLVTGSGGLTINGGGLNLYQDGTTNQFSSVGSYNLFQYTGTLNGSVGNFSVLNPDPTKNYAFSADGTNVKLAITASAISQWGLATGGTWASAGSWTGSGVPNASGATAMFGNVLATTGTVTLDGNKTVATIAFDNVNSYTLAPATTESLFLDNTVNSGQAQIVGTNGSHQILSSLVLTSNTVVSAANIADTLTLSGIVSGNGNLIKSGAGTLVLSGASTFTGDATISNGKTTFSAGSLGAGTKLSMGGSTLRWAAGNTDDISAAGVRTVEFLPGNVTWDTNGNNVSLAGSVGNSGTGSLVKTGAGTLTLSAGNNYTGSTTVSGGSLSIGDDSALGSFPGSAIPGMLTIDSATLGATATFTIDLNRGIALNSASSTIDVAAASTLTYGGIVAGAGKLNLTGSGTLDLATTNTYSGGTVINTGATLNLSGTGTPGTGQLTLAGGTLTLNRNLYTQNNVLVDALQTGTIDGLNDRVGLGGLTGSGTITLITRYAGANVGSGANGFRLHAGNGGFTGTVNLKSGTGTVNSFAAHFNGGTFEGNFSGATIHMSDFARLGGVNNSTGNTMTIGALSGDTTAILSGADYAGSQTYNIGGKGLDTTFAGLITNGSAGNCNIIKSGIGKLTLSGTNTYAGTTTVNAGTLAVENTTALGVDTVGTTIAGGDVDSKVTIAADLTLTEPWTLGGRQLTNADSPAIVSLSGNNTLSGLMTPVTGGDNYNVQSDAGTLTMSGDFVPTGTVTGTRYLQLLGAGNGEWSGSIQNGTASVTLNCKATGTWTLSGINSYTGDTLIEAGSTLVLAPSGEIKFEPAAAGVSGRITGGGTATLNGSFKIDLTAAETADLNTWILVDSAATYGGSFTVSGFTKSGTAWTKVAGSNNWTFEQTTGVLSLAVTGTPYSNWATANGLTVGDNDGPNADPDNDGIENQLEFVLGGNPLASSAGILPSLSVTPSDFVFTFTRNDDSEAEIGLTFQHGTDLVEWTPIEIGATSNAGVVVGEGTPVTDPDTITITIPKGTNTRIFGRLQAVKTP